MEIEISNSLIDDLAAMLYSEVINISQGEVQDEAEVIQES